jgi:hypothetical protein
VRTSYPTTSEEATKVVLSLLLAKPAVIEFDDMVSDWIPHGTINRMLTSGCIADRVLGSSKIASVSTRTLVLGSGNNVGPTGDLLRRVLTINLDQRCPTPATRAYRRSPVESVRNRRGEYVSAVLTIIEGVPRSWVTSSQREQHRFLQRSLIRLLPPPAHLVGARGPGNGSVLAA